jgi:predicted GIY-YIG superfamily endonuclease
MPQLLLFPDPRPLVERLGVTFFRELPPRPGVYLMHDDLDTVLYVGKAKNLRQRLGNYRVANPERMLRRHLRLLRAVMRIELEECSDEAAALARESELLRELKPRFNRAGTWPASPWYLTWRHTDSRFEMILTEHPEDGWSVYGPRSRRVLQLLRSVLARLLWCSLQPERGLAGMPPGWVHGGFGDKTIVADCSSNPDPVRAIVDLLSGREAEFEAWLRPWACERWRPFDRTALQDDLEFITDQFSLTAFPPAEGPVSLQHQQSKNAAKQESPLVQLHAVAGTGDAS